MAFPLYKQHDAKDCGPTCLQMIAKHYGRSLTLEWLREKCAITRLGVSMLGISEAAQAVGFRTLGVRMTLQSLVEQQPLPCILHWKQNHFVVCYKVTGRSGKYRFHIADPAGERVVYSEDELRKGWMGEDARESAKGFALLLEPGPDFKTGKGGEEAGGKASLLYFLKYLRPHRRPLLGIIASMAAVSGLSLLAPWLTQAVVDKGIGQRDLGLITMLLLGQLAVFFSQFVAGIVRDRLTLKMTTRINISLISDFLAKLMRLPIRFFDSRLVGDITQRIQDHDRIEAFLTGTSIGTLFSMVNFVVFAAVLFTYDPFILLVFVIGNALYVAWVQAFMRRRRKLDFKRFSLESQEQSNVFQLITGMQEIKLNNCETQKLWKWRNIQDRLFKTSLESLRVSQWQQAGGTFFQQLTNILTTFIAARAVVDGSISLGMMMAISYIIGQLSGPVSSLSGFLMSFQYAKMSLERLDEVNRQPDEEPAMSHRLEKLPIDGSISVSHLSFSYSGAERHNVLHDICLTIPQHRVTAIVGASGSGKTTLVKLLLGFYAPTKGSIRVGGTNLADISTHLWRDKVGAVLQEGMIFSDDIAHNIAPSSDHPDIDRVRQAARRACLLSDIESLPMGFKTNVGAEGMGLSQGQQQRLLIARAIYKKPEYIFLDEATNSLDANNERAIMQQLEEFYRGRTVLVVAHRLSTVRNADKIVVLDHGRIVEEGTHEQLTAKRGAYFTLVRNQLELGE